MYLVYTSIFAQSGWVANPTLLHTWGAFLGHDAYMKAIAATAVSLCQAGQTDGQPLAVRVTTSIVKKGHLRVVDMHEIVKAALPVHFSWNENMANSTATFHVLDTIT